MTNCSALRPQGKATINWSLSNGRIVYDLEVKTFNDIVSRTREKTSLILILLCLPKEQGARHDTSSRETTLRHCCYLHIVTAEPTENSSKKRIHIPCESLLTLSSFKILLNMERRRMSGA